MRITGLALVPPPTAHDLPKVTPELLASVLARYSRSNEGIGNILAGHVSIVDVPDGKGLSGYTRQVLQNTPIGPKPEDFTAERRRVYDETFGKIKYYL